jgi:disulfide bond formation protein DsbB
MMNGFARLAMQRPPWLLLALTALLLEAAALYFQHVGGLDPCVLCVYQRLAVLGIAAAGLLVALAPALAALRWLGLALWGVSAAWGLKLAMQQVGIQFSGGLDLSCSFFAEFPAWAPLDQWLPAVFMPTGTCDEIQWMFLGLSMPQWMLVIFALYLAALVLVVFSRLTATARAR